jgi:hypothetical protein
MVAEFGVCASRRPIGSWFANQPPIRWPTGPKGTATHGYRIAVGISGSTKEVLRTTTKDLLTASGYASLIGAGRFKSGAGVISELLDRPSLLCVIDEFGSFLSKITDAKSNPSEKEISDIFRELWGIGWGRYDSQAGAHDKSEKVENPALSILGLSTPEEFYRACKNREITNGFLNRFGVAQEKSELEDQEPQPGADKVPEDVQ